MAIDVVEETNYEKKKIYTIYSGENVERSFWTKDEAEYYAEILRKVR